MAFYPPKELPSGPPPPKCALSISEAKSPTTKHVKAYVRRVSSKQLLVYPTWDLSKPLPSLPVPTLAHTLDTYLKVLKPITTEKQYREAVQLVQHFQSEEGPGNRLQQWLQSRSTISDNWAYSWWLDDMYLLNQAPLPIHSNPGMVFPRITFSQADDQLRFAARLVSGILDYKVIIDARGLPIDRARHREKGQPLCMEQYYRLFSSYREPGILKDRLITTEYNVATELSDHIIVMCRNKMYQLNVVDGMNRLSEDDICCQLRRIQSMAEESPVSDSSAGLGILTTLPRNEWAKARDMLKEDVRNAETLVQIETSIFVLCLDVATEGPHDDDDDTFLALHMLHGHGSHLNSCNRWYDKTMQFIVGEDGACGLNYEHSPSEGIAVVQLIEHVLRYMEELRQRKLVRMNSNADLPYPIELSWSVTAAIIQSIDMARFNMDRSIADLELNLLKFEDFGKEFPKSQNMSPDCFIQLALQLTYFRLNGHLVSTYESASTRRFKLGRVDNIRAASTEALRWCEAMQDDSQTVEQRLDLLRKAMISQTDYMVQTILGHGMDCHMLGLKQISEEMESTTPELFLHDTWKLCNHFSLSTSQVNTTLDSFMCYGPVVHDGYGASYNPQANQIMFCISSFASCETTSASRFTQVLESVLREIHDMCLTVENNNTQSKLAAIPESNHKPSTANSERIA